MKLVQQLFYLMIPFIGIIFLFGSSDIVEANKYYSLQEIGLSGCATDSVDYAILSIRGNTVKYMKYQISKDRQEWKPVSGVQTGKLTSKTKCYVGDARKVSNHLKSNAIEKKNKKVKRNNKSNRIDKNETENNKWKSKNRLTKKRIDTEKWIYRIRKSKLKRNIIGRNNEILVRKGKVIKLAVRLVY